MGACRISLTRVRVLVRSECLARVRLYAIQATKLAVSGGACMRARAHRALTQTARVPWQWQQTCAWNGVVAMYSCWTQWLPVVDDMVSMATWNQPASDKRGSSNLFIFVAIHVCVFTYLYSYRNWAATVD